MALFLIKLKFTAFDQASEILYNRPGYKHIIRNFRRIARLCLPTFMPVTLAVHNSSSFNPLRMSLCEPAPLVLVQFGAYSSRWASFLRVLVGTLRIAVKPAARPSAAMRAPRPRSLQPVIKPSRRPAQLSRLLRASRRAMPRAVQAHHHQLSVAERLHIRANASKYAPVVLISRTSLPVRRSESEGLSCICR